MLVDYIDVDALREGIIRLHAVKVDRGECPLCLAYGRRFNGTCWECIAPYTIKDKEDI